MAQGNLPQSVYLDAVELGRPSRCLLTVRWQQPLGQWRCHSLCRKSPLGQDAQVVGSDTQGEPGGKRHIVTSQHS